MPLTHVDLATAEALTLNWQIDAAESRVWDCLTTPAGLSHWLGRLVDGAVAEGESFVIDHGEGYRCTSRVLSATAPRDLSFTWEFPDEPASEVGLTLAPAPGGSQVTLRHAGLGDLTRSYLDGWCTHLSFLEGAALGTPLPFDLFWKLHGTIAALNDAHQHS